MQSTIQSAINTSVDGDVVCVDAGTYAETIDFLGKAVTVQSELGPGVTVIDGGCPLMFGPTADTGHKVMKAMLSFSKAIPRRVS